VLDVPLGKASDVAIYGDDYPTPDGTCVRDYIHVRDLADAHILALNSLNGRSRVYNLGNGAGFSVKQLIEVARSVTGHPIPVRISARRAGDVPWLVADSQRIRAELGWRPLLPKLEEIIATAWEWRQAYPNGYAD
jgi:UDP-glucose 4-epimerase